MFRIGVFGDLMPGGVLPYKKGEVISQKLSIYLDSFDVRVATLECAIGDGCRATTDKRNIVFAPESSSQLLTKLNIDIVSLANNHVYDLGKEGLSRTMEILDEMGIKHCGAGHNIHEARKPVIIKADSQRIGFLAYCHHNSRYLGKVQEATENQPGVAPLRSDFVLEDIAALKSNKCDIIALLIHWGIEYTWFVQPESQRMAKEFIEAGASVIFGGHSHRIQPIQRFSKGMAYYSMGNFLFPDFMLKSPLTIYYPEGFSMNDAYTLPVLNKYAPVSVPSLRVWPNLSRIGLIAELQICNHCIKIRQRMVRIKRQSSELDLYPRLLTRIYRAWLWLFSIIIRLPVYSWFYCKMLRLS